MKYNIKQYLLTDSEDDELTTVQYTQDRDLKQRRSRKNS